LKQLIANDLPIIVRTLLKPGEDFAHYRVIKGYDDINKKLIQDASLDGKGLSYTYDAFMKIWKPFNYEYLVLVPKEKKSVAESILGEEVNAKTAWQNAVEAAQLELENNPTDREARLNLAISLFYTGDHESSVKEFEKIRNLPMRALWYRLEPVQAYYELGNYEKVFSLSLEIFGNKNIGYAELYLLRGQSYLAQNKTDLAKAELEKAVLYNKNLKSAKDALNSLN
jgi:tetratricopeptide (TPR) repeat protein